MTIEPSGVELTNAMQAIDLAAKLQQFHEHWQPRIVAELNGQHVKLAKIKGEFVWHKHDEAAELFFVLQGHLKIEFTDRTVELGPGQICVVPRGVLHRPVAEVEVHLMLFEPVGTRNTGDVVNERTHEDLPWC